MITARIAPTLIGDLSPREIRDTRSLGGWISPAGAYFRIDEISGHVKKAIEITGQDDGWLLIEQEGWIKLSGDGKPLLSYISRVRNFSSFQRDTLWDLATLFEQCCFGKDLLRFLNSELEKMT